MPITCQICLKEFKSLITSTHLKTHGMSSKDYAELYGRNSLASPEYRETRSTNSKGEQNGNYGKHMSDASRQKISVKNKGSTPWNKGIKTEATAALRSAIDLREEKYRSGVLDRHRPTHSPETRAKISASVRAYAADNVEELRNRGITGEETKRKNGFYETKRAQTLARYTDNVNQYGFDVDIFENTASLKCRKCNHTHTRCIDSEIHEKMCPACGRESISRFEREIADFVKNELGIECRVSDKTVIPPLELDIVIADHNLAIEANGLYWHSEAAGKSKFYHSYKTKMCNTAGYRLIHIFEDEWAERRDVCKKYVRAALGLIAGSPSPATVEKIPYAVASEFLTTNHILGCGSVTDICYAAYSRNDIVAVMSFKQRGTVFTLERYAAKDANVDYCVPLFNQFVKDYTPTNVISYMDIRWEASELYNRMGFVHQGTTLPNYWYVKGMARIHRHKLKLTERCSQDTEYEIRKRQGYTRIWDCGCSVWAWVKA